MTKKASRRFREVPDNEQLARDLSEDRDAAREDIVCEAVSRGRFHVLAYRSGVGYVLWSSHETRSEADAAELKLYGSGVLAMVVRECLAPVRGSFSES